jgi:hypothetical protein
MVSRSTFDLFKGNPRGYIKDLNKIDKHVEARDLPLRFPKLDVDTLKLFVYADTSFCNNDDMSSQLGYIILSDSTGKCQPLIYSSQQSKRVTRSVLGGEVMAFADGIDMTIMLKHSAERMICRDIPIHAFTRLATNINVISSSTTTSEKRLMIDITAAKEEYEEGTIDRI